MQWKSPIGLDSQVCEPIETLFIPRERADETRVCYRANPFSAICRYADMTLPPEIGNWRARRLGNSISIRRWEV